MSSRRTQPALPWLIIRRALVPYMPDASPELIDFAADDVWHGLRAEAGEIRRRSDPHSQAFLYESGTRITTRPDRVLVIPLVAGDA